MSFEQALEGIGHLALPHDICLLVFVYTVETHATFVHDSVFVWSANQTTARYLACPVQRVFFYDGNMVLHSTQGEVWDFNLGERSFALQSQKTLVPIGQDGSKVYCRDDARLLYCEVGTWVVSPVRLPRVVVSQLIWTKNRRCYAFSPCGTALVQDLPHFAHLPKPPFVPDLACAFDEGVCIFRQASSKLSFYTDGAWTKPIAIGGKGELAHFAPDRIQQWNNNFLLLTESLGSAVGPCSPFRYCDLKTRTWLRGAALVPAFHDLAYYSVMTRKDYAFICSAQKTRRRPVDVNEIRQEFSGVPKAWKLHPQEDNVAWMLQPLDAILDQRELRFRTVLRGGK